MERHLRSVNSAGDRKHLSPSHERATCLAHWERQHPSSSCYSREGSLPLSREECLDPFIQFTSHRLHTPKTEWTSQTLTSPPATNDSLLYHSFPSLGRQERVGSRQQVGSAAATRTLTKGRCRLWELFLNKCLKSSAQRALNPFASDTRWPSDIQAATN